MALPAHSGPWPLIQFRNHFSQTIGLLWRVISPSQGRYLNTGQHKPTINAYAHRTSMPWVGFEPTIPASEQAKTARLLWSAYNGVGVHLTPYVMVGCLSFGKGGRAWTWPLISNQSQALEYVYLYLQEAFMPYFGSWTTFAIRLKEIAQNVLL
jgi:hypothetical protein